MKGSRIRGWGIVRYAPGSGDRPEQDCAAFDGWYSDQADAASVYADWCKRYPNWIVALVQEHEAVFPDRDWSSLRRQPCPLKCHP
jgi:hypothetical protein